MYTANELPDVMSNHASNHSLTLQWVGMEAISLPVVIDSLLPATQVDSTSYFNPHTNPQIHPHSHTLAKIDVYVSLDKPEVKGIHMSRLYRTLQTFANQSINKCWIEKLLREIVVSQDGISSNARIQIQFEMTLNKPALKSENSGYQSYPVTLEAELLSGELRSAIELKIPYSSTCPCSASLSQTLLAETIDKEFSKPEISKASLLNWLQSEQGLVATPHNQRSFATIKLRLGSNSFPDIGSLVGTFESTIGTPLQTAVKRTDEQEFARLNAQHLMFCEDAARKIKAAITTMEWVEGYALHIDHQESLHAHNAVVIDRG